MVKFKEFSRPLSVFQVLFKANFIFKDFSRQSCIFKYFSSLCEPCTWADPEGGDRTPLGKSQFICFFINTGTDPPPPLPTLRNNWIQLLLEGGLNTLDPHIFISFKILVYLKFQILKKHVEYFHACTCFHL